MDEKQAENWLRTTGKTNAENTGLMKKCFVAQDVSSTRVLLFFLILSLGVRTVL